MGLSRLEGTTSAALEDNEPCEGVGRDAGATTHCRCGAASQQAGCSQSKGGGQWKLSFAQARASGQGTGRCEATGTQCERVLVHEGSDRQHATVETVATARHPRARPKTGRWSFRCRQYASAAMGSICFNVLVGKRNKVGARATP